MYHINITCIQQMKLTNIITCTSTACLCTALSLVSSFSEYVISWCVYLCLYTTNSSLVSICAWRTSQASKVYPETQRKFLVSIYVWRILHGVTCQCVGCACHSLESALQILLTYHINTYIYRSSEHLSYHMYKNRLTHIRTYNMYIQMELISTYNMYIYRWS